MIELRPSSVEEAQALLQREKRRIAIVGGGTQLAPLPAVDAVLYTGGLAKIVEYAPSDQVVTAEAGTTLAALQAELAKHGQRLALDPPHAEKSTLGGIVAGNSFGPLRTRYGSVRDLIIGVSVLRADGTRAKGGGKVVKTVAGFDLPKLMCGSHGTLGLIVTITFRVHPLPEHRVTLLKRGMPASGVFDLVRKMRAQQLEPAAMLATRGASGWDVAVRFEGFRDGVVQQRQKLPEFEEAPATIWAEHLATRGIVRVGALPADFARIESAVDSWYPTLGLGFAQAPSRAVVGAAGGWVTAPGDWGPAPSSLPLHQAVKARLDPEGLLAPGSFIGGL